MDHYEVLGVRPNAGREEIELAFKGRRSQYHPDRYARSDAETQAWATGRMKEINEAYRVLTSAELRAEFDRRRSAGKPGDARPQPQPEPPTKQEKKDAASVLLNPKLEWFHDRVYARPRIPRKKLEGAISSYAQDVSPDAVLVLLDDTLFGGAKEGMLVTSDAIYYKQKFESPKCTPFSAIRQVEPGADSRIVINGREVFKADLIDHFAMLTFALRLSDVFKPATPANGHSASSSNHRSSGIDQFLAVHRGALEIVQSLGASTLLVALIARQMECIAEQYGILRYAIEAKRSIKSVQSVDSEAAELALTLLLILHFHGFSKLPTEFKEAVGSEFAELLSVSELYKQAYRDRFAHAFGRQMELSEHDLLMMSSMFLGRDGSGSFELNLPRDEAISLMFPRMGIPREVGKHLVRQFEDLVESWFATVCATFEE